MLQIKMEKFQRIEKFENFFKSYFYFFKFNKLYRHGLNQFDLFIFATEMSKQRLEYPFLIFEDFTPISLSIMNLDYALIQD